MTRDERNARFLALKHMGCIACLIEGGGYFCGPAEIHHLNMFGKAGMKRIGDEATVPLGRFHHRGDPPDGMTKSEATYKYGPSLALDSIQFRACYGEDSHILTLVNAKLAQFVAEGA